MANERIGIFGGSFDPPHLAHTMVALWALQSGEIDRLLVIPVARHAFDKRAGSGFEDRLTMCRLAFSLFGSAVEVSDIEGKREGVSYMVDTLRHLRDIHRDASFRLIVGSDVAGEVDAWREGALVKEIAPLLEIPRRGDPRAANLTAALPGISSTEVRESLRTGGDVSLLVPKIVREYIATHRLYHQAQEGVSQ